MKVVVDRFEGEFAVCQELSTKRMMDIPKSRLPAGTREGSVLEISGDEVLLDQSETADREGRIKKLMDELWE
jgi:hypothetical protein